MKNKVLEEVKHTFRPEFLNRLDETVVFHQLTRPQIEQIVGLELEKVIREVKAQEMFLEVTEEAKSLLAKKGWDPQFGARPLRRAIQREVEDELAEEMLRGKFGAGDRILCEVDPDNPDKLALQQDSDDRAARGAFGAGDSTGVRAPCAGSTDRVCNVAIEASGLDRFVVCS